MRKLSIKFAAVLPPYNKYDPYSINRAIISLAEEEVVWSDKFVKGLLLTETERKTADEAGSKKKKDEIQALKDLQSIMASGSPGGGGGGPSSSSDPPLLGKRSKSGSSMSMSSLSDGGEDEISSQDQKKARSDRVDAREFKRIQAENITLFGDNFVLRAKIQVQLDVIKGHEEACANLEAQLSAARVRIQILEAIDSDYASASEADSVSIPSSTFRAMEIA